MNPKTLCRFPSLPALSLAMVTIAMSAPALAGSLLVPQIQVGPAIEAAYHCPGGKTFKVTYFNSDNGQSFALLPIEGVPTLMVSTASADGVRYQSGFVTWWSKGREGSLYDARMDPDKPVLRGCRQDNR